MRGEDKARHAALLLLGAVLASPLVLGMFEGPGLLFGLPRLYVYLFTAWALLIALAALTGLRRRGDGEPRRDAP